MRTPAFDTRAKPDAPHSRGNGTQYDSSFLRKRMRHTFNPHSASSTVVLKRSWLRGMASSTYQPLSSMEVLFSQTAFQS